MQKEYPKLEIPQDAKCIRWPNERGIFDGRADSEVYIDSEKQKLYKRYSYKPESVALYHALHDRCAENIIISIPNNSPIRIIDNIDIKETQVHILPLYQDQIFHGNDGTITTPIYIPWPTLHNMIQRNTWNGKWGYTRFAVDICEYVSEIIGRKLQLPHPNFYPHIGIENAKYKIENNTLYILITDIGWPEFGIYDLIRSMKHTYGNPILTWIVDNIEQNKTIHSHEIVQLFLQNESQTTSS